jgi:hypothetical protein
MGACAGPVDSLGYVTIKPLCAAVWLTSATVMSERFTEEDGVGGTGGGAERGGIGCGLAHDCEGGDEVTRGGELYWKDGMRYDSLFTSSKLRIHFWTS